MLKYIFSQFKKANHLPTDYRYFLVGGFCLLAFLGLFFIESRGVFNFFDYRATVFLQSFTPRFLDTPLSLLSLLGSFEVTTLVVLALGLLIFRQEKRIYFAFLLFGMILVFEFAGKLFLYHPNPPKDFFRYTLPFSLPTLYVDTGSSFPSGHVSRTVFLGVTGLFFLAKYLKKHLSLSILLIILYTGLMVLSRIYLGEHWASDTLGGLFLGGAMGFFAVSYY